jgi:serine/threonine protein kinase
MPDHGPDALARRQPAGAPQEFGKYQLLTRLRQGGTYAHYLAVGGDRGLDRPLIVKTLLPREADPGYVARFHDQASRVIRLSHDNLMPVFDAGFVRAEAFLAMDFVEGFDLRTTWNRCAANQVAFPVDVAVHIARQLCRGLAYAHAFPGLYLVHGDVSPPSIQISYAGKVKVPDFGLALSTLDLERHEPGVVYGKPGYLSPEQARCEPLDGRSDLYTVGIVLWELLTGRALFPPSKDSSQDLAARASAPPVLRPSLRAPRVPAELDEICLRALAPDRYDRYAECGEMAAVLQTWLLRHAPATDEASLASLMRQLFAGDILRERTQRAELLWSARERAGVLRAGDERGDPAAPR